MARCVYLALLLIGLLALSLGIEVSDGYGGGGGGGAGGGSNNAPELLNPSVNPTSGNSSTVFVFSVRYVDKENQQPHPTPPKVIIDDVAFIMNEADLADRFYGDGKDYIYSTKLSAGNYTFSFTASDGANDGSGDVSTEQFRVQVAHWVLLTLSGTEYSPGDLVTVEGTTSNINGIVYLEVDDPKLTSIVSVAVPVDKMGEWSHSFRLESDAAQGIYIAAATVAGSTETLAFTVMEIPVFLIISEIVTADIGENPESVFKTGETVIFSMAVENPTLTSKSILVAVQVSDPELTAFPSLFLSTNIDAGAELCLRYAFLIASDGALGDWTASASVFTDLPSKGGSAVAEPKEITFTLVA